MGRPVSNLSTNATEGLARAIGMLATDPEGAEAIIRDILVLQPTHTEAGTILGTALHARGRLEEAQAVLQPLAKAAPDTWMVHFELAQVLLSSGLSRTAINPLSTALDLNPGLTHGWQLLGDLLMLSGDVNAAQAAYARHIRSMIRDPLLKAPADALVDGRLHDAERDLRALLNSGKAPLAAVHLLAEIIALNGQWGEAEKWLALCLRKVPDFALARQSHVIALIHLGLWAEAIEQVDQLLAQDPRNRRCRMLKAAAADQIGDYAAALASWNSLLNDFPDQPRAWLMYGRSLQTIGRTDEAIVAYKKAILLDPSFGEAYWSISNVKTARFSIEDTAAMKSQLRDTGIRVEDRIYLQFALAKALEDDGNYKPSFGHYAEGAKLKRSQIAFDPDETAKHVLQCKTVFTAEFFKARAGAGLDTTDPIFIVGLPRSGSTLVEQILASHSAVEGTMELQEINSIVRLLAEQSQKHGDVDYIRDLKELDSTKLTKLGERFITRTKAYRKLAKPFFVDKMPNNFLHIGLIRLILPNAKIVDVRRHPVGACFSAFKQYFGIGQNFSYDLADVGRYYRDYVELMAHLDEVLPGKIHRVHYEALVTDTESEIRSLLRYCELPFEESCLKFHENERAVKTPSAEQVRQPIFRDGMEQWRRYEPWLDPLKTALGPVLDAYPAVPASFR